MNDCIILSSLKLFMCNKQQEIESSLISNLLGVTLFENDNPKIIPSNKKVFLDYYSNELRLQNKNLILSFDDLDNIIYYRLKIFFLSPESNSRVHAFQFLVDSYNKFINESTQLKLSLEIKEKVVNSVNLFPKYCALIIQCPELFEVSDLSYLSVISELFETLIPVPFFTMLLQEMEKNDSESLKAIYTGYIESQLDILKQRSFLDLKLHAMKNILFLSQFKQTANIIVQIPSFIIYSNKNNILKTSSGLAQQNESFLGCIINPNPLDKDLKTNDNNPALVKYFSGLLSKTHSQVNQNKLIIRQELSLIYEQSLLIFRNLLKTDTNCRRRVLKWMGMICTSNESKSKMLNSIPDLSILGNIQNSHMIQSNIRSLILRTSGQSTNGFSINFLHIVLKLLQPVKIEKVVDLDCLFHLLGQFDEIEDIKSEINNLLGNLLTEATLGDKEQIEIARNIAKEKITKFSSGNFKYQETIKFPTQIFWLSCKTVLSFMHPLLLEYENKLQEISEYRNNMNSIIKEKNDSFLELLSSEAIIFECAMFHPQTISSYWHFLNLFIHFLFRTIFSFDEKGIEHKNWDSSLISKQGRISLALKSVVIPKKPSPQFSSLPSNLIEEIMSITELIFRIKGNDELMVGFDFDSYISLTIIVIAHGNYFKNPHFRSQKGVMGIHYLLQIPQYRQRIENSEFAAEFILPSLIALFNDVQKSPYFDRFSLRLPIILLFETLLKVEMHRRRLHTFVKQRDETFTKFIHLLVSDLNYLLEEGLSMLAEVKKRESRNERINENHISNIPGNSNNVELEVSNDRELIDSTIEEMPIERLEHACKGYMQLSHASASLLQHITEYNSVEILDSPLILPQIVTCLNCTLDRLVGPKCLELKVSNFEAYNFNPRQLLANICMTYITLAFDLKTDNDAINKKKPFKPLLTEIVSEQRYFKVPTFVKAHYIARREGLLGSNKLEYFGKLIRCIQEEMNENEMGQGMTNVDDIDVPEEFLDPIMQDLMHDPVLLPTSSKVMDRKVIERILISDGVDPFNRLPLSKDDLIPQNDLKERIKSFFNNKN